MKIEYQSPQELEKSSNDGASPASPLKNETLKDGTNLADLQESQDQAREHK